MPLHNAGWAYPWKGGYRRTMGGYYVGHPAIAKFKVEVVNKNHPITAGVESYEIVDEQHFLWFDYDRVEVLLVSQGQDGRQLGPQPPRVGSSIKDSPRRVLFSL